MLYVLLILAILFCLMTVFDIISDLFVAFSDTTSQKIYDKIIAIGPKWFRDKAMCDFLKDALILFFYITIVLTLIFKLNGE